VRRRATLAEGAAARLLRHERAQLAHVCVDGLCLRISSRSTSRRAQRLVPRPCWIVAGAVALEFERPVMSEFEHPRIAMPGIGRYPVLPGTGTRPVMFRYGWSSAIESPHEPGSGAAPAGAVRCERGDRSKAGAVPRICRAVSPDSTRAGPCWHALGSRNQVRRLPHAGASPKRMPGHLHTAGLRLDAALQHHRRCSCSPAGRRPDPGWRSPRRGFARRP
jgi:hypothetical protein